MSSKAQLDSVIDDDDELCPLCIEEFDLSDKNFKPCPCGYQICQFCYNNIKTHNEEGRCPNCRRVYDESTIQYRVPDVDEFKADLAQKHRKAAAAKRKEAEKREIEASSRKNLAGVRVVQKNLVYVIGLNPTIKDENQLLQTLRGEQYFGQYGEIEKIVVSKAKPGGNPNQGIGVYVTFARKADAATCIAAVDGSQNGDRILRAQYGTTKYCSSFLRNEPCNNRNCTFLHETGDDNESYSRQDLSSINTTSSQRPHGGSQPASVGHPSPHVRSVVHHPPPSNIQPARQGSTKEDGSALPSSASWANKDNQVQRTRRASMTAHRSTPSPKPGNATVANKAEDSKAHNQNQSVPAQTTPPPGTGPSPARQSTPSVTTPPGNVFLDNLVKAINSPDFRFVFSTRGMPADEITLPENFPSMIDPYGGVKRRAMREKAEQERAKQEAENRALAQQSNQAEEENPESGSSQLGGEPEEPSASGRRANREPLSVIQPPSQQQTAANSVVGSPMSTIQQFQNLNLNGRTLTPFQQQQLMMLKGANGQQANIMDQVPANTGVGGFDPSSLARAGAFANQSVPISGMQGHARQSSRFSFANDSGSKNPANQRILGQQTSVMQTSSPNPLATPAAQHGLGSHFFTSGVQGPPPGLKTAGTPPVSGGGMFAQGHGFTSAMNTNLGIGMKQDANTDLMRELMRGRGGTTNAGVQAHEAPKLDLADPSILQARMHQSSANAAAAAAAVAGQGLYGSQGQAADEDFPPLAPPSKVEKLDARLPPRFTLPSESPSGRRTGTPTLPPGLPLPHAHPLAADSRTASPTLQTPGRSTPQIPPGLENTVRRPASEASDTKSATSKPGKDFGPAETSLGSPKPKSSAPQRSTSGKSLPTGESNEKSVDDSRAASATPAKGTKSRETSGKQKPIKLDLSGATERSRDTSPSKVPTPSYSTAAAAPPGLTVSRPNTPATVVSKVSETSLPRQPRVLRVVDTPKTETPPPAAPATSSSSTPAPKQRSRKPSLSSASRPATPGEVGSEYTSASVSRANSPPPSKVGSAPVRTVSRNQLKKERKLKAKQAEEKEKELAAAAAAEEPVQAPIIGRKRKTKKPKQSAEPSPTPTSEADKANSKEESGKNGDETPQKKEPEERWRTNNTLEQLIADAEALGATIKDLFLERTKPLASILAELHHSGQLDLNTHPLFNPPPAHQRIDMKCTAEDYDRIKKPIELTTEHKKQLLRGEPVRINPDSDLLKDRCIITPSGCVLRHLSKEEEDRYLALEKSLANAVDSLLDYPAFSMAEPDPTNQNGGLDALFATPEKFNIRWVDEPPQSTLMTGPSDADPLSGGPSWTMGMIPGSGRSTTSKTMFTTGSSFGADLEELMSMPDDELKAMIQTAQKELEASKKEADAMDKKVTALVKRNKKLVQQALAAAMDLVAADGKK
ncbi:hypothetical protein VTO42DRAFT_8164 [Malbranchea cinnamomea]